MAYISFSALRTPKVGAGFAPNAESERTQDLRLGVYPEWNGQDVHGRPVPYHSRNVLTAGVSHPLARIDVENMQRPSYDPILNTQGISGDTQYYGDSFGGYDTMGVRRDEAFQKYGEYSVPGPTRFVSGQMSSPQQVEDEFLAERKRQERALRRRFETNRYSQSGM